MNRFIFESFGVVLCTDLSKTVPFPKSSSEGEQGAQGCIYQNLREVPYPRIAGSIL